LRSASFGVNGPESAAASNAGAGLFRSALPAIDAGRGSGVIFSVTLPPPRTIANAIVAPLLAPRTRSTKSGPVVIAAPSTETISSPMRRPPLSPGAPLITWVIRTGCESTRTPIHDGPSCAGAEVGLMGTGAPGSGAGCELEQAPSTTAKRSTRIRG
jgi:hypothetical protein